MLGDRVRMARHACGRRRVHPQHGDARPPRRTRARDQRRRAVLDAAGKDVVIIETVGVGQDEVDIVRTADVSIVVLVPGTGDDVQALKAGIMEIADIFVVNKADREGADRLVQSIAANLSLQTFAAGEWRPPILKTEATTGEGVAELWAAIGQFRAHSSSAAAARRRRAPGVSAARAAVAAVPAAPRTSRCRPASSIDCVDRIAARELDPYSGGRDDAAERRRTARDA